MEIQDKHRGSIFVENVFKRNPQQACWAEVLSNTEKLIQISFIYSHIFKSSFMLNTLSSF